MRHIMGAAFLFLFLPGFAQDSVNGAVHEIDTHFTRPVLEQDRCLEDSLERARRIDQNVSGLIRLQKENRSKQKKQAILRITLGVFFLVVLIVGLTRKRKKNG